MLPRPELLLNPWPIRDTATEQEELAGREDMPAESAADAAQPCNRPPERMAASPCRPTSPNLDFLAHASAVLLNAKPDEQGRVQIDRETAAGQNLSLRRRRRCILDLPPDRPAAPGEPPRL